MKPVKFEINKPFKRDALPGLDYPWKPVPLGSILPETKVNFNDFSVVIKESPLDCLRCATSPKPVNFINLQKMLKSTNNRIKLELKATKPGSKIMMVGAQYAVEGANGCEFVARLHLLDSLGNEIGSPFEEDRGQTINVMNGRAVFLGIHANPGENIQTIAFSVTPKPGFTINGLYINSLRVLLG